MSHFFACTSILFTFFACWKIIVTRPPVIYCSFKSIAFYKFYRSLKRKSKTFEIFLHCLFSFLFRMERKISPPPVPRFTKFSSFPLKLTNKAKLFKVGSHELRFQKCKKIQSPLKLSQNEPPTTFQRHPKFTFSKYVHAVKISDGSEKQMWRWC